MLLVQWCYTHVSNCLTGKNIRRRWMKGRRTYPHLHHPCDLRDHLDHQRRTPGDRLQTRMGRRSASQIQPKSNLLAPYSRGKREMRILVQGLLTALDSDAALNTAQARRAGVVSHLPRSARVIRAPSPDDPVELVDREHQLGGGQRAYGQVRSRFSVSSLHEDP